MFFYLIHLFAFMINLQTYKEKNLKKNFIFSCLCNIKTYICTSNKPLKIYIMKTFLIQSNHEIFLNSFSHGDLEQVNFYQLESKIEAETPEDAVKKYIETELFFKNKLIDKDEFCGWTLNNLVDENNASASDEDIFLWSENRKNLFTDYTKFEVYELKHVNPVKDF